MKFATEIVSGIRKHVGNDFIIIFRLSMMDLVNEVSFIIIIIIIMLLLFYWK